jgi:hypothetical protein
MKFTNANLDGQTNAGARVFLVGRRTVAGENVNPPSITVAAGSASRAPLTVPNGGPSYGAITVSYTSQPFSAGDNITVTGMGNTAYNTAWARVMSASTNSFTYWVLAPGTDTSGGGTITRANRYSLALENNTTYYYRIGDASNTCGASPATGTFTTMNWPNGDTWPENFPTDATGNWATPSVPESQAASVSLIDPITGTLAKPMSLYSDAGSAFGMTTALTNECSYRSDSNGFIHCYLLFNGGSVLYGFNESTGEVRYLGNMLLSAASTGCVSADGPDPNSPSVWDTSDANVWYGACRTSASPGLMVYKATYTGNDVAVSGNTWVSASATQLTPSPNTLDVLIHNFDATFNASLFNNRITNLVNTHYLLIILFRWSQGSPGWFVVFDLNTNSVVAATNSWANQQSGSCAGALPTPCSGYSYRRWSGVHGQGDLGATAQGWAGFSLGDLDSGGNMGPFTMQLTGGVNNTDTTAALAVTSTPAATCSTGTGTTGDPMSQSKPPDGSCFLDQALPGDIFKFTDTNEIVMVTVRTSATALTVARGCHSSGYPNWQWLCDQTGETAHSSGATLQALSTQDSDPANPTYNEWNFTNDTHGTDTAQTNMVWDYKFLTGHFGSGIPWMMDESWGIKSNATWNAAFMTKGPDYYLSKSPAFASQTLSCEGNSCDPYVSYAPYPSVNFTWDTRAWNGGPYSDTATVISSGTGYVIEQYNLAAGHSFSSAFPYFSMDGGIKLIDISGPSSALTPSSAGNYTVCVVKLAGECWSGSTAGQIYANLPASETSCTTQSAFGTSVYTADWCFNNFFPSAGGALQLGLTAANQIGTSGGLPVYGMGNSRKLALGLFMPPRNIQPAIVLSTRDQQWIYWANCVADPYENTEAASQKCLAEVYMAKVPPQPTSDGIDRTNFENVTISVGTTTGATQARLKWGYQENEAAKSTPWPPTINFYCQQYQGRCYWNGSASSPSFNSGTFTALPLNSNATLQIGVPQRVLFYQIDYFSASGAVVATDPVRVAAIP